MGERVRYELDEGVAHVTMDDGKANALSPAMFAELHEALDRATADDAAVLLTGREGRFSAGFDLKVLQGGGADAVPMMLSGFELALRLLAHPRPVVVACNGHAYAMGFFLLLSSDLRIGVAGSGHRCTANEVAIGMPMPHTPIAIMRHQLQPSHLGRVCDLAEVLEGDAAVAAGALHELVPAERLAVHAGERAAGLAALDRRAHAATKARRRADLLVELRRAVDLDAEDFRALYG